MTIFRWFAIGPDRYVVTGDNAGARLAGYAGKDARAQAKRKAEALATWSRFLGHGAVVRDVPPLRQAPATPGGYRANTTTGLVWSTLGLTAPSSPRNGPTEGLDRIRPASGFTWSTLGLKRAV